MQRNRAGAGTRKGQPVVGFRAISLKALIWIKRSSTRRKDGPLQGIEAACSVAGLNCSFPARASAGRKNLFKNYSSLPVGHELLLHALLSKLCPPFRAGKEASVYDWILNRDGSGSLDGIIDGFIQLGNTVEQGSLQRHEFY